MNAALLVPLVLTMGFGAAFTANEASHGWLAETMGVGHHHVTGNDRHCHADHAHAGPDHAPCDDHHGNATGHTHDHDHAHEHAALQQEGRP